jgi:hypothetical protein
MNGGGRHVPARLKAEMREDERAAGRERAGEVPCSAGIEQPIESARADPLALEAHSLFEIG